ncbi:hypothetical protein C922_00065 [Plasmodium inui San Antonio 1]|uniref:Uncharacterized protein n=1 Tax=Plasmodium inui San Antonio 1 TaxID=1237626 RepID=W7A7Q1_9APIC|nr:hypothetical protein C922_00065 [Plasmodium inui San Antonio 1]EUD69202.1 hypothetical protein C922_00065 [Plasmodium inui San Antonio 1]
MQSIKRVENVGNVENAKPVERVGNNRGEGNGREFEGTELEGNLPLKKSVKIYLHNSNEESLSKGSSTNDPSNIGFTKENLNLLFNADEERNSLDNVDSGDDNTPTRRGEENCPQGDRKSGHNNESSAHCTDPNGNPVSEDNSQENDGNLVHVEIGARFREDDYVSDQCASDDVVRKTGWHCGISGVSSSKIIDRISGQMSDQIIDKTWDKTCDRTFDKTCDEAIDLTNRSDHAVNSGPTAGRSNGGNSCYTNGMVRVNSANSGSDNSEVERGEGMNGSTQRSNIADDPSRKTYTLDGVEGSGLHNLEGKNTRDVIKVMYTERVEKCGLADITNQGGSPNLKKEKSSVNHNFDKAKKQNGAGKWVNFNHGFEKSPSFNEQMEELKFLEEIYQREKVDKGEESDAEVNQNFKVTPISETAKLSVARNANLNCHYRKDANFNREDKVKSFTSALSHLIKNNMEVRQKGDDDHPFRTLAPPGRTFYEPISAIPGSFLAEEKINKINITYSHHQDGNNQEGHMEDRSITKENYGEGLVTSKCASNKEKDRQYMSSTQHDVPNSDYSFNGKINLSQAGANGEAFNMSRHCLEKVTFVEANRLFEHSKVTNVESPEGSRNGISVQNRLVLHKDGCERFNPNLIHYGWRKKEAHSVWSGRNLSKRKIKPKKELHLKGSIKESICENDKRRARRRDTTDKREKYSIHVSDYFSNRNDDYSSYMMSEEGAKNRLASDLPVVPPCNDHNYPSRRSNETKMLRHVGNQFVQVEEAPPRNKHIKEDMFPIEARSGNPPHLGELNNDVPFTCNAQSCFNKKSTEGENILGEKRLSRGTNNQNCNNTLFCCPVKEVTSAPPRYPRTATLMNKLFRKAKRSPEHVDKKENDFKCADKVSKASLEETKRDSLLSKRSVNFKEDKSDLFELPTGEKGGRTFDNVSNGANESRRLFTNCPTIPCEPFKEGRRTATQLYKAQIRLPTYDDRGAYRDRTKSTRRNSTTMNTAPPTAMPYPKCELICRIPKRAFTTYFQGRDC